MPSEHRADDVLQRRFGGAPSISRYLQNEHLAAIQPRQRLPICRARQARVPYEWLDRGLGQGTSMRELRIGLVGAGWMGKVHSMSYRTAQSAFGPEPAVPVLAAIADINPQIAERAARDFGYERAAKDWREIIDDPTIDIVDICTPNDMHFEVAMAAIEAGKHVNCEKPLANRIDHARQMAEAATKKGVTTIVGFNYIQNPVHVLAREAIRRGDIGDVNHVRLFFVCDFMADRNLPHTWRNDLGRAGSGMIGDVGAHCLSYFYYLLDRRIEEVFCQLETVIPDHAAPVGDGGFRLDAAGDKTKRIKNTTDDIATVIFHFSDGGSGEMSLNRVATGIRYNIGYDRDGVARDGPLFLRPHQRHPALPLDRRADAPRLHADRDGAERSALRRAASRLRPGPWLQRLQGDRGARDAGCRGGGPSGLPGLRLRLPHPENHRGLPAVARDALLGQSRRLSWER